ncbi:MAG: hypothetical protein KC445_05160 [Anaerolineales bacterium]|nr:hypothetical protein [Anaerolineales bacterium]
MKHYQLVFVQRHPETHILQYQLLCDDQMILSSCSYQEGYAEAYRQMTVKDTLQEIEGKRVSKIMTYVEMLEGHLMMNDGQL